MRIPVTGGAGFIGSHYVRTLLGGGYMSFEDVAGTVLDMLTYAGNLENLEPVAGIPRCRFVRGDIADAPLLPRVLPRHSVNFAAKTRVDRSITGAADLIHTNVVAAQTLFQVPWTSTCRASSTGEPTRFTDRSRRGLGRRSTR